MRQGIRSVLAIGVVCLAVAIPAQAGTIDYVSNPATNSTDWTGAVIAAG